MVTRFSPFEDIHIHQIAKLEQENDKLVMQNKELEQENLVNV